MISALFDFLDFFNIECPLGSNLSGISGRDRAQLGHCFASERFNLEPDFQFSLLGPYGPHLRQRIAFNHQGGDTTTPQRERQLWNQQKTYRTVIRLAIKQNTQDKKMMKFSLLAPLCASALILSSCNTAEKYAQNNDAAAAWLAENKGNASTSISGSWLPGDHGWGMARLEQNGNQVTGAIGSYQVEGSINGKTAYLAMKDN